MAFPTIRSYTDINAASQAGLATLTYPATVNAGDTLILISNVNYGSYVQETGWTQAAIDLLSGTSFGVVQYKIADGSEGGTTFTPMTTHFGSVIIAVAGPCSIPYANVDAPGTADVPTPPTLTPAAGSREYLWIIHGRMNTPSGFTTPSRPDTSWTTLDYVDGQILCNKEFQGSTLTPGPFIDADAGTGSVYGTTIAIYSTLINNNLFFGCNF